MRVTEPLLVTIESRLPLPQFTPAIPTLRPAAFDRDDFIFELKMGEFRALAHLGSNESNCNVLRRFGRMRV